MQNFLKITTLAAAMLATGLTVSQAQQAEQPVPSTPEVEQSDDGDGMSDHGMGMGNRGDMGHGGKRHGGKHRGGRHGALMIDVNMDGVVSDEEAAMLADHAFSRMDEDRNEALNEAEFTTPHRGHRGWFGWGKDEAAAVTDVRKAKFAALDADKNGSVSKVEFFADAKTRLAAADADKDGKVTPWEFRASPRM